MNFEEVNVSWVLGSSFFLAKFGFIFFPQTYAVVINPFSTNVPLLYPRKTSENRIFSDVFRGCRSGTLVANGLMILNERLAIYLPTTRKRDYLLRNTWISKERFWLGPQWGKKTVKQLPTAVLVAEKNLWVTASHSENAYSLNQNLVLNNYYIKIY